MEIFCIRCLKERLLHRLQRMQETLYQTADAGASLSDSGCRSLSIRQRMHETLSDSRFGRLSIRQRMRETLYPTADAGVSLSNSGCSRLSDRGCRRHSIRQRMQESPSHSKCRRLSIRQRLQETLYQTADAGVSLLDSGCRRHSNRQRMQETLYQTADAGVSPSDSGYRRLSI